MMLDNQDPIFQLAKPIKVSKNGEFVDAELIWIAPPNMQNLGNVAKLKELLIQSIASQTSSGSKQPENNDSKPESEEITAEAIQFLLQAGGRYSEAIEMFKSFMIKFAKIDDISITSAIIDKMDSSDFEALLGAYFASFLFPKK
jgi:hypothetical protein